MDSASSTHWNVRNFSRILIRDLGIEMRITLKWILQEEDTRR
jgi:hypothetical protein